MASIEVLPGPERRRRWSIEQKRAIVTAAFKPGAVVRDVARRTDVTSSLIYPVGAGICARRRTALLSASSTHRR
jgi:transposase-like protein